MPADPGTHADGTPAEHRLRPEPGRRRPVARSATSFLDTNVLVYAVSSAPEEAAKKRVALDLIATADFGLSAQVLQELYLTLTRKAVRPLPVERTLALLDDLRRFPLVETDWPLVVAAIEASMRFGIAYWDGAIVAAAARLGAAILYTEDLNHGQLYGEVRALNPFLPEASSPSVHEASNTRYGQSE
jgi:predicted nucleic acid-binding protein